MFMNYTQKHLIMSARWDRFMSKAELAYHHISARSVIGEPCLIGWLIYIPRLWAVQMAALTNIALRYSSGCYRSAVGFPGALQSASGRNQNPTVFFSFSVFIILTNLVINNMHRPKYIYIFYINFFKCNGIFG